VALPLNSGKIGRNFEDEMLKTKHFVS